MLGRVPAIFCYGPNIPYYNFQYGRTLYSAVYHHTFIKICCVRARRRWCQIAGRDRGPVINIVVPHAPSLVPRLRACHKHCGLGSREATL